MEKPSVADRIPGPCLDSLGAAPGSGAWATSPCSSLPLLFFFFFFVFFFLGPLPRHMEVPRLGVESEL